MLENDRSVLKWVKPPKGVFRIDYANGSEYEPDFVAETASDYYLCEPKAEDELDDSTVKAKAKAAATYCVNASTVSGKPWHYLLIPHTAVDETKSIAGLAAQFEVKAESTN